MKGTAEYFNSSRLKVIGMITAATLAVGALGAIAGVAFDPDPVPKDHVVQPGGGRGTQPRRRRSRGPGQGRAPRRMLRPAVHLPASRARRDRQPPTSVGSISPG